MQAMTQNEIVLKFMRENGYITSMQAFGEGITRLASRIHDLRKQGYNIHSVTSTVRSRYGRNVRFEKYFLSDEETIDKHD